MKHSRVQDPGSMPLVIFVTFIGTILFFCIVGTCGYRSNPPPPPPHQINRSLAKHWWCRWRGDCDDPSLYRAAEQELKWRYWGRGGKDDGYSINYDADITKYGCEITVTHIKGNWAILEMYIPAGDPGTWWMHKCKSGWHLVTGGTEFSDWSGRRGDHNIPKDLWPENMWRQK